MPVPEQSVQQAAEDAHLCIIFMVAHARTRDIAEAKDAADHAMQHLAQLAKVASHASPLSGKVGRLRAQVNVVRRNLARQQVSDGFEESLRLANAIRNELKGL
ncbi:hypothetical protein ACTXN7_11600 [Corynebacterium flavescens]|uniref:hypothetical protein n=1 Tax=Corynebacterium flavescens TaxID=28028 RepID=UPI003FD52591